mgnify:CR=1 FL=1
MRMTRIAVALTSAAMALASTLPSTVAAKEHQPDAVASDHHDGAHAEAATELGTELTERLSRATGGETIILGAGIYRGNFVIDVPLTLAGRPGAVLDGGGSGTVLTVKASGVVVQGLSVIGSGAGPVGSPAGISIQGNDVLIQDVKINDSYIGISTMKTRSTRILDSEIVGRSDAEIADEGHAMDESNEPTSSSTRGDGISLNDSRWTLIRGVKMNSVRDGIYLSFGANTTIDDSEVRGSRYGIHAMYSRHLAASESLFDNNLSGAILMYGGPLVMVRNTFSRHTSPSTGFGVLLRDVTRAEVARNVMTENRIGVQVEGPAGGTSGDNRLLLNTIASNQIGIALFPNAAAAFAGNSILGNIVSVSAQGSGDRLKVEWMDKGAGNFWDTYRGFDEDGDGLGDVPHEESGTISNRIRRAPFLAALGTSPAFKLIDAVHQRWTGRSPLVVDRAPLMTPLSPPLPGGPRAQGNRVATSVGSMLILVLSVGLMWTLRSRKARRWKVIAHAGA